MALYGTSSACTKFISSAPGPSRFCTTPTRRCRGVLMKKSAKSTVTAIMGLSVSSWRNRSTNACTSTEIASFAAGMACTFTGSISW